MLKGRLGKILNITLTVFFYGIFGITIVFLFLMTYAMIYDITHNETDTDTYTTEATVIEKDLIKTPDGNLWCADTNNKMIGGTATVVFENNGTPENIRDDIIIRIN